MSFWSNSAFKSPLRQFRFYLTFGTDFDDLRLGLIECDKPKLEIPYKEFKLLNHWKRFPGVPKWQPINIKFLSTRKNLEDKPADYVFWEYIISSGFIDESFTNMINKADLVNNLAGSGLFINQIDEEGKIINRWKLNKAFFTNINFGELSYKNENFVEISATIIYDNAVLQQADNLRITFSNI